MSIEEPFTILPLEVISRTIEGNVKELQARGEARPRFRLGGPTQSAPLHVAWQVADTINESMHTPLAPLPAGCLGDWRVLLSAGQLSCSRSCRVQGNEALKPWPHGRSLAAQPPAVALARTCAMQAALHAALTCSPRPLPPAEDALRRGQGRRRRLPRGRQPVCSGAGGRCAAGRGRQQRRCIRRRQQQRQRQQQRREPHRHQGVKGEEASKGAGRSATRLPA